MAVMRSKLTQSQSVQPSGRQSLSVRLNAALFLNLAPSAAPRVCVCLHKTHTHTHTMSHSRPFIRPGLSPYVSPRLRRRTSRVLMCESHLCCADVLQDRTQHSDIILENL